MAKSSFDTNLKISCSGLFLKWLAGQAVGFIAVTTLFATLAGFIYAPSISDGDIRDYNISFYMFWSSLFGVLSALSLVLIASRLRVRALLVFEVIFAFSIVIWCFSWHSNAKNELLQRSEKMRILMESLEAEVNSNSPDN